jgi:hypothetical protein
VASSCSENIDKDRGLNTNIKESNEPAPRLDGKVLQAKKNETIEVDGIKSHQSSTL